MDGCTTARCQGQQKQMSVVLEVTAGGGAVGSLQLTVQSLPHAQPHGDCMGEAAAVEAGARYNISTTAL
jgi:hypothetical protein